MWRSFFLAIGAYCCLLGVEALTVERGGAQGRSEHMAIGNAGIIPPDWAPWSLLGAGAVVVLYSFTVPQRVNKG